MLDVLPDTPTADRRALALYALGLLTRSRSGGLNPFAAYRRWLVAAGCADPHVWTCPRHHPITLVRARRTDRTGRRSVPG